MAVAGLHAREGFLLRTLPDPAGRKGPAWNQAGAPGCGNAHLPDWLRLHGRPEPLTRSGAQSRWPTRKPPGSRTLAYGPRTDDQYARKTLPAGSLYGTMVNLPESAIVRAVAWLGQAAARITF